MAPIVQVKGNSNATVHKNNLYNSVLPTLGVMCGCDVMVRFLQMFFPNMSCPVSVNFVAHCGISPLLLTNRNIARCGFLLLQLILLKV